MKLSCALMFLLSCLLTACGQSGASQDTEKAVDALIKKTEKHLVYVKGGSFEMGGFGPKDPKGDYLPWSVGEDDKHLHKVTLDGYYIMDRQVSYADYDTYTEATGEPKINMNNYSSNYSSRTRAPDVPAGVDWCQARDYCQWLAKQTGLPFALPTEAQWEYAARSRGKIMPYATDDGILREGKNYPTREDRRKATAGNSPMAPYTIAKKYPPTLWVSIRWGLMVMSGSATGMVRTIMSIHRNLTRLALNPGHSKYAEGGLLEKAFWAWSQLYERPIIRI